MIGQTLDLDGIPAGLRPQVANQVGAWISHETSASKPNTFGSLKRAIINGRTPLPPQHRTRGHRVGPVRMRLSAVHGYGVFAAHMIRAGEHIISVRGKLLTTDTIQTEDECSYTWAPAAGGPYVIDQYDTNIANIARYINSSGADDGNVGLNWYANGKVAVFQAITDIAVGEELLCKYALPLPLP